MAGKKMIHNNICTSDKLNSVSEQAENLWTRLLSNVDGYGHITANPYSLKDICYSKRDEVTPNVITSRLNELASKMLIKVYTVHCVKYIELTRFEDFQDFRKDRGRRKDYPMPKGFDAPLVNQMEATGKPVVNQTETIDMLKGEGEGEGEGKDKGQGQYIVGFQPTSAFEEIWALYPNKDGKKAAKSSFKASVKTEQDFADIKKALDNYLSSDKPLQGFIKNGSTWFNNWRDWINYKGLPAPVKQIDKSHITHQKAQEFTAKMKALTGETNAN